MKFQGFIAIGVMVALLHVAVLSLVFGPFHWKYLLCATGSGIIFWTLLPCLLPLSRRAFLISATILSVAVQQITFWIWRHHFDGVWWPLIQSFAIHALIVAGFAFYRSCLSSTYIWRGKMLKKRR